MGSKPLNASQRLGLTLDPPWGEHMVVQAGRAATPAGTAGAAQWVTVRFGGFEASAQADAEGRWQVSIPVPALGGPYAFSVSAGDERIDLKDVLVGEVWLASGQSNMEWPLLNSLNADQEIAAAERPHLRLYRVPRTVGRMGGAWTLCTPEEAQHFSAVAYHFGRSLSEHGIAPVGLIQSVWGGTPAEPWMEAGHARQAPGLEKIFQRWEALDPRAKAIRIVGADFEVLYKDACLLAADGTRTPLRLSGERYTVQSESQVEHEPGRYAGHLGPDAWTYAYATPHINDWTPFTALEITVSADCSFDYCVGRAVTSRDGDHHAFPVVQSPGEGWKTLRFEFKDLGQRGWGEPKTLDLGQVDTLILRVIGLTFPPERPGILFDAMIRPMASFAFKGVLWYQGESNEARRGEYGQILKALISGWRGFFKDPTLPFLVVQLPDIGVPGKDNSRDWATLRDQQMQVLELEGAGLTVSLGLGDGFDAIHPRNKRPVGERLAQEALRIAYGRQEAYGHGPRFKSVVRVAGGWLLSFDVFGARLQVLGGALVGFEGAKDGRWEPIDAGLRQDAVFVDDALRQLSAIRYAWHDSPIATLGDDRGLPTFGFLTLLPS